MTGAKGKMQVLKQSLEFQGNYAFNKNKYFRGERRSGNDSSQATEGIQLDQQKRHYHKAVWDLIRF